MAEFGYQTMVTHPVTGQRMTVKEWADKKNIHPNTLVNRLNRGSVTIEEALQAQPRQRLTADEKFEQWVAANEALRNDRIKQWEALERQGKPLPDGVVKVDNTETKRK